MAVQTLPVAPQREVKQSVPTRNAQWGFLRPHRFSVEQYEKMIERGILGAQDKVELIEGEILEMSPAGGPHSKYTMKLFRLLAAAYASPWVARIQCPIKLTHSEPEPDIAFYQPHPDEYEAEHPTAKVAVLVVEVSETSLHLDRQIKAPLYAQEGIPEYWIVDLANKSIEVHREPGAAGYGFMKRHGSGDTIDLPAIDGARLAVDELFPPESKNAPNA